MNKNKRRKKHNPYKRKNQMSRTIEQVSREYQEKAALAGHVRYQIQILQEQEADLVKQMKELNLEANKIKSEAANEQSSEQPQG